MKIRAAMRIKFHMEGILIMECKQLVNMCYSIIGVMIFSVFCIHASTQSEFGFHPLTPPPAAYKSIILIQRSDTTSSSLQAHLIVNLEHPHMQNILSKYSLQEIQDIRNGTKRSHIVAKKDDNSTHTWMLAQHMNSQELGITGDNNSLKNVILQSFGHQGLISFIKSRRTFDTVVQALPLLTVTAQADRVAPAYKYPRIILSEDVSPALFLEEARKRIPEVYAALAKDIDQKAPQGWKRSIYRLLIAHVRKIAIRQQAQNALNMICDAEKILQDGQTPMFGILRQNDKDVV